MPTLITTACSNCQMDILHNILQTLLMNVTQNISTKK